jgi:uncharacterized membrane protein
VTRSLPALLSLLALPAMYWLAWELFTSSSIALLATTLLALSPFDVLFAQTARQYSLLTVMVILSSAVLLRAIRLSKTIQTAHRYSKKPVMQWVNWGGYAASVAVGLYTHPFFALTLVAHGVYLHGMALLEPAPKPLQGQLLTRFWLAIAAAIVSYSPWLVVMLTNRQRALATTDWSQTLPGLDYLLKLWILSFTSLFFDLDVGFTNPWTFIARLPFLLLIGYSVYLLYRRTTLGVWGFVILSFLVPFLLLALPDLVLGGKRSAVSRYLISCFPAIQLAVAYGLGQQLALKTAYSGRIRTLKGVSTLYSRVAPWLWRGILAGVVVASLASITVSASANSWWNKDLSYFNDQTADLMNRMAAQTVQANANQSGSLANLDMARSPILVSDIGDDYTNTGDLISLSYRMQPSISLMLLKTPSAVTDPSIQTTLKGRDAYAFRPSKLLFEQLQQTYGSLQQPVLQGERLWKIPS